jgi:hypothetical protein
VDAEHEAQVHDFEHVQPEVAQVVVHRLRQFRSGESRNPRAIVAAPRADLGDEKQEVGVVMQRLADEQVGDLRAV